MDSRNSSADKVKSVGYVIEFQIDVSESLARMLFRYCCPLVADKTVYYCMVPYHTVP